MKGNVLRIAKHLVNRNRDCCGSKLCEGQYIGKIVVEQDRLMEIWRAHYDKISNEEFAWDKRGS